MENLTGMPLNKALKSMRTQRDLTQVRLAEAIGVSTFTLIRWERGERTPDGAFLEKLAKAMGYWLVLDTEGTWNCFPCNDDGQLRASYTPPSVDDIYEKATKAKDNLVWSAFFQRLTRENPELEAWLRKSDGGAKLSKTAMKTISKVIMAMVDP